jgi:ribonuclease D
MDRATFRVLGNEQLLEIAKRRPSSRDELATIKGMPRGLLDARAGEMIAAVQRGLAVPDAELPRFPKSPRWDRDPDFESRVSALKAVRDEAAVRLDLDPGVLCSRDRLEAVARKKPKSLEELDSVTELRKWQRQVLGEAFVNALSK